VLPAAVGSLIVLALATKRKGVQLPGRLIAAGLAVGLFLLTGRHLID
jgi:hypothetical protein